MSEAAKQVWLYDTTLRDGAQGAEVNFSLPDKLELTQKLDAFGVDYIEGGWPGSNPKDVEYFQQIRELGLSSAKVTAFGSTRRAHVNAEDDDNLQQLVAAETPATAIFGKSWTLQVTDVLGTTLEENCHMIRDSVAYLGAHIPEVIYDAEHFFDGYRADPDYALQTLEAAVAGGADWLILCDTNGGSLPEEVSAITEMVRDRFDLPVGIHAHNDGGLGVANSLAAVRAGATQVQGTINGYGERTGNADLCAVIPNLALKMEVSVLDEQSERLQQLTRLSRTVSELANLEHDPRLPFVGKHSFTHKGGAHVNAMLKTTKSFEHIPPETIGNARRYVVSELSGKSNVLQKAEEAGLSVGSTEEMGNVLEELKRLELEGYQFEDADASFELILRRARGEVPSFFELIHFHTHVHREADEDTPDASAMVKLRIGEAEKMESAEGDGPVSALDRALRKALCEAYPQVLGMALLDYKVRILESERGTGAKPRVTITTGDGDCRWSTVGVAYDILEASWQALADGYVYGLDRCRVNGPQEPHRGHLRKLDTTTSRESH
ncbi:MAG: citramalate synthase [Candidatus Bipolaricaulia bacterium]